MDPAHSAFVTYVWLVGSGLTVLAIVIPMICFFSKGKVNKEMCRLMHDNTDKVIALIHTTLTSQGNLIQQSHDTILRIEIALEKNGVIKKRE
jgi:flagellar basal body-associated protein FliL